MSLERARALQQDLTKHWGENAPSIRLVDTPAEWTRVLRNAGVADDPQNGRIEGLYNGEPVVWLNLAAIPTEQRFAEVLAHEALGHYGVERIVGTDQWRQISGAIDRIRTHHAAAPAIQSVIDDVNRRYVNIAGGLDMSTEDGRTTFAKEVIAVLAERGVRNSFVNRVVAAVQRWLRRHMPNLKWSERDILGLLGKADSFLRAGRTQEQQAALVQRYAFSKGVRSAFDDAANWASTVRRFVAGNLGGSGDVQVTQGTPDVYAKLGVADKPFVIRRDKLALIRKEHPEITEPVLMNLVRNLHEPAAVFQSGKGSTSPNGLVALTEAEVDGKPILIALHMGVARKDGVIVNRIASYYGKDSRDKFLNSVGALRYIDQSKTPDWLPKQALLPKGSRAETEVSGGKILTDADVVKPFSTGTGAYSREAPTFYSAALEAVQKAQGLPKAGATAAQWKGWLDGAERRGEFKKTERDWLGVDDWLAQREKTTPAELAGFIRDNQVQVQDVVLGEQPSVNPEDLHEGVAQEMHGQSYESLGPNQRYAVQAQARDEAESQNDGSAARYAKYQLPGGENYRELLLTLPSRIGREPARDYRSSHFVQPNILAHVRFNERTDTDGNPVLFLEEIQSDWHQAGRKDGYTAEKMNAEQARDFFGIPREEWDAMSSQQHDDYLEEANSDAPHIRRAKRRGMVPDAPLKGSDEWSMLAFKRMVRWAADNGVQRIGWTTGQQQAERYEFSQEVSRIEYIQHPNGTFDIDVQPQGESSVTNIASQVPADALDQYVGKEMAKMRAGEGERLVESSPPSVNHDFKKE